MTGERWRMGGDDRERRFNPPYDANDELPDFGADDEQDVVRKKITFGKAWSMLMASVGAIALIVGSIAFLVMHGLKPLGVIISYGEALVVSGCFFILRFVDMAVFETLRKRSQ